MKLYKLPFTIHQPTEDNGGKYLAEVPLLPGCRAWGDSAAEALDNLQSVTSAFVESHTEHNDPLPAEVEALAFDVEGEASSELVIAV